jgi:hypothetical protein
MVAKLVFVTKRRQLNTFFRLSVCYRANWLIIRVALGVSIPHRVSHLFGTWLEWISTMLKPIILLGTAVTIWSIWLCKNDLVFEKKKLLFFAGYLLVYTPTPLMGYPLEAGCTWFGYEGSQAWVAKVIFFGIPVFWLSVTRLYGWFVFVD